MAMSKKTLTTLPAQSCEGAISTTEAGRLPSIIDAMQDLKAIRTFVHEEMREGLDYGKIPGTGDKPTLLLPGAQKVAMMYNTMPEYDVERIEIGNGHLECLVKTRLVSRSSGMTVSTGFGSCSSMESKYRWRNAARACPKCGAAAIITSRPEYGSGFVCYGKKGGCGAKFRDHDPSITGQESGRVENTDIHDIRNTVLKMGLKRSIVSAAMSLGCMAELFTQDLDDIYDINAYEPDVVTIEHRPTAGDAPLPAQATLPPPRPQNHSGSKTGQYASDAEVTAYRDATLEFCRTKNAQWADEWADERGEMPAGVKDVLHPIQLTRHLLKWALRTRRLAEVPMTFDPETGKPTQKTSSEQDKKYVAIVFAREAEAVAAEAEEYFRMQADEARQEWREKYEDESGERDDADEPAGDDAREG